MITSQDFFFIKKTFSLAKKGAGWTNPNPMVGAVIVKDGKIIAQGYHKKAGSLHAEVEAIKNASVSLQGTTLYINLEPCSHFGHTPPCVDAIVKTGIKRVVCSVLDPNPLVQGKGIAILEKAGIEVSTGVLENEARKINEAFHAFHEKKLPFVAIKFAASLDGKIATKTGDSKWITNEKARNFTHKLRSQYQSILVGINTVLNDDPHLGSRLKGKKDPLRIIVDPGLKIPLNSKVLRDNNVLVATTKFADKKRFEELSKKNIDVFVCNNSEILIKDLLEELRKRQIISVLVEGGGETLGRFADAGLINKVYAFYAPIIIGGKKAVSAVSGEGVEKVADALRLKTSDMRRFDDNCLLIGYP